MDGPVRHRQVRTAHRAALQGPPTTDLPPHGPPAGTDLAEQPGQWSEVPGAAAQSAATGGRCQAVGEIETLPVLNLIFFGPFAAVPCS